MTHLSVTETEVTARHSALCQQHPCALHLDGAAVRGGIARRRQALLNLEMAMVASCEADAARGRPQFVRMDDRGTWDRATWNRYLAAATRVEPQFGPPMHRLLRDIDRLQRLLSLITAMEAQT